MSDRMLVEGAGGGGRGGVKEGKKTDAELPFQFPLL
jgi:hypothetical protein